jgi:hypothetical protein
MTNPVDSRPSLVGDERRLWWLFAGAWLVHVALSLVGWNNTLIGPYEFRQAQTAITTLFFPPHGFKFAYETPLFGTPWFLPLEFPVFEASVAWFSAATGMPLDPAGRLLSWLYFQLSLPAFYLLLGSVGMRRPLRWLCLGLLLTSPVYLFYSRNFLIESTALCFCAWFLAAFARWISTGRVGWLLTALAAGALGSTVKVTTMVVFGVAACLFVLDRWSSERRLHPAQAREISRRIFGRALAAFLVPVAAGLAWLVYSASIRGRNPDAAFLSDHFGFWSFGDLAQRLSRGYWVRTISVWTGGLVSEGGLILGLYLFARLKTSPRRVVLGAFGVFLSGQLIFSNLYEVHEYYFYASGAFLIMALGMLLAAQFEDVSLPRWARWGLPIAVMLLQLVGYARGLFLEQQRNEPVPQLTQIIHDLTDPEDMVVVLGQDWNGVIPYYAQRRAMMFTAGRERDPAAIARSTARLDPARVGAVLLYGNVRNDRSFVRQTMATLGLGSAPLLTSDLLQVSLWIPQRRLAAVRDRLPSHPYTTMNLVTPAPALGDTITLGSREISRMQEFSVLPQRPVGATTTAGFSNAEVGTVKVLNAHATSELVYRLPPALHKITARYGIHEAAYANPAGRTDGVEFAVVMVDGGKHEQVLYSRLLNPATNVADREMQSLEITLPKPPPGGEILFRTLPGPKDDSSFDWAYWAAIELH